jgi:GDP-L-fucose synthase
MKQILNNTSSIFVAGHRGMVGSAIVRRLESDGYTNIIRRTHDELDLMDQRAVRQFFKDESIDYVVLAAAKVGGIYANNTYPADFIYRNMMIGANVIHEAYSAGVERLLFLGSSCIYPKDAQQPMKEEYLLSGKLEPTNEPYAIAKIAGIKLCDSYNRQYGTRYRSVMPTNLYGPNDNFDLETSHVLPALIRKFHLAKLAADGDLEGIRRDRETYGSIPDDIRLALGLADDGSLLKTHTPKMVVWGTGSPYREFLHVDDMANACVFVMNLPDREFSSATEANSLSFLNIGSGRDMPIHDLAETVREIVGFNGEIFFDIDKPDGMPLKRLDVSRLNLLGWKPEIGLKEGIAGTYEWYLKNSS